MVIGSHYPLSGVWLLTIMTELIEVIVRVNDIDKAI
jgi:hypothetical protein